MRPLCVRTLVPLLLLFLATPASAFPGEVARQEVGARATRHAVWLDADADGDADLAVADRGAAVRLFRDDGGAFSELPAAAVPAAGGGHRLAAGDLDRDGDPDLVACTRRARRRDGSGGCTVLLNRFRESGELRFEVLADVGTRTPRTLPLLADHDGDGDLDVFLLPQKSGRAVVLRNDLDDGQVRLAALSEETLALASRVLDAAVVDQAGGGTTLYVTRRGRPALLLVLDPRTGLYRDLARERGLPRRHTRGGLAVAGDFDRNRRTDLLVLGTTSRALLFLQAPDGSFTETRLGDVRSAGAAGAAVADFDRDRALDLFVARARGRSELLRNLGGVPPSFADVAADAGVAAPSRPSAVSVFERLAACDHAVDLAVASAGRAPTRVHRFPDDSAASTVHASERTTTAPRAGSCLEGTDAAERLVGHRVASVLRGGGGDDVLIARAGVTVMEGGPGRDTLEAAGFTIVRLPPADIVPGETVRCGLADAVWVDSPLTRHELEGAGVVFDDCAEEPACTEPDADFDVACHGGHSSLLVTDRGDQTSYALLRHGLDLGLAAAYDYGVGECSVNADCWAIGLDVCRDAYGNPPSPPAQGTCYPSDFDGLEGPIAEWCQDPFWARYRYEQVRAMLDAEGRRLVVPVVVWIVRSEAASASGFCSLGGHEQPPSIADWHDSFTTAMGATAALYAKWGIAFDYAFRLLEVPSDSAFVVDPASDACRTKLKHDAEPGDADAERTVGKLLQAYPTAYRLGSVNIYLSDVAPEGQSSGTGVSWTDPARFIVLFGTASALSHEMGHEIGLGHPYKDNVAAAGVAPDAVESRDSWLRRPFPDPAADRLHACATDADCTGVDAPAGVCRRANGAATGFCQNLKKDCAENGDGICDTPWDAVPCFQGVNPLLLDPCVADGDCHKADTFRGTSYLTACVASRCRRVTCTTNADCDGGSWCAAGACVNYKTGFDACCDLHTDRRPGFVHNACYERRPNGTVVATAGVGSATAWPIAENVMAYHRPTGLPRTLTDGQRDTVVCKLSYTHRYGQLPRLPRADGEPCSLRPGGSASTYGPVGVERTVPHGACASGICRVQKNGDESAATCLPSSCTDGLVGADEASRDCGGACGVPCPTLRPSDQPPTSSACADGGDCVSGVCGSGVCQPTCTDAVQDASELGADAGGAGFATGCAARPLEATCRFEADCAAAASCEGDGACIVATDCPVNGTSVPCTTGAQCPGGECRVLLAICQAKSCVSHAQCDSGVCDPAAFRCRCATTAECGPGGGSCQVLESACTKECVDGRCLGVCKPGFAG